MSSSEVKPVYSGSFENTFIRMGCGEQRATQQGIMSMDCNQSFGIQSQKPIHDTNIDMLNCDVFTNFYDEVSHWGLVPHLDSVNDANYTTYNQLTSFKSQRWLRRRELLISISLRK